MNFEEELYEVILSEVDEKETPPGRYNIERGATSIWKHGVPGEILIVASWWEEPDEDTEFSHGRWKKYFVSLSEGDPLFDELQTVFTTIEDRVTITDEDTVIDSFSWSENTYREQEEDDDGLHFEYEWMDDSDLPFNAFLAIEQERDYSENGRNILREFCSAVSNQFNDTVTITDVNKAELLFSDFEYCSLQKVRLEFTTRHPHKYYESVDSIEEYVEVVSDDEGEFEELMNQRTYAVDIPLNWKEDGEEVWVVRKALKKKAEELMRARIDTMVTVTGPYSYEAESIVFEDGVESTTFWLRPYFDITEIVSEFE